MSYTPTNWVTGDIVTAEKLNKIEQGIANENFDLVLTELAGETDSTFTLKGLSFDELYEKGFINHKGLRLQSLQIATPDNSDQSFSGHISDSFSVKEDEIRFLIQSEPLLEITKEESIFVAIYDSFAYTATYDSTTKEYTLTPYEQG